MDKSKQIGFKFSRLGLTIAGIYLLIAGLCVANSISSEGDSKGAYVLMQLPIAIQGSVMFSLGFGDFLRKLSWTQAYMVLAVPTLLALYFVGHITGALFAKGKKLIS